MSVDFEIRDAYMRLRLSSAHVQNRTYVRAPVLCVAIVVTVPVRAYIERVGQQSSSVAPLLVVCAMRAHVVNVLLCETSGRAGNKRREAASFAFAAHFVSSTVQ